MNSDVFKLGVAGASPPLRDDQLVSAGDIADQAVAVAESLAMLGDQFAASQITVGVTDESQVGPVELELRGCGVGTIAIRDGRFHRLLSGVCCT